MAAITTMLLRTVFLVCTVSTAVRTDCPPGDWWPYSGACYYPSTMQATWEEARAVCESLHSDLVSIRSDEENMFVLERIHEITSWTGLNDRGLEGNFSWSDGSPLDYTNWYTGQPAGGTAQNCVLLVGSEFQDYTKWNDHECSVSYRFTCKMAAYNVEDSQSTPLVPTFGIKHE